MSERVEVSPFFERGETGHDGFPAESYVAGLRETGGDGIGVEITLPAEIVERTVLTGSRLSVSLSPEGRLVLDGEGLSDEVLEAASAAGRTLRSDARVARLRVSQPGFPGRRGGPRGRADGSARTDGAGPGAAGRDARRPQEAPRTLIGAAWRTQTGCAMPTTWARSMGPM